MRGGLESQVWRSVQQACDVATFKALIQEAVDSFKRPPGLDPLARLHASDIGPLGIQVLSYVLRSRRISSEPTDGLPNYLELRSRLKDHIRCYLQWYLVNGEHVTDEILEDQLDRDLGL